jgi:hypothetical protein
MNYEGFPEARASMPWQGEINLMEFRRNTTNPDKLHAIPLKAGLKVGSLTIVLLREAAKEREGNPREPWQTQFFRNKSSSADLARATSSLFLGT